MAKVTLKEVRANLKCGQTLRTTTFEITGKPPHVFAIKKIKK